MPSQPRTVWQDMQIRGYSRRDFNKLSALMAAAAGGGLPAIASAGVFLAGRVWHDITREEE